MTTGDSAPPAPRQSSLIASIRLWWRNTRIRHKVLAVAAAAITISLPLIAVAVVLQLRLSEVRDTNQSTREALDDLTELKETSSGATEAALFYSIGLFEDPSYVEDYRRAAAALPDQVARLERQLPTEHDREMQEVAGAVGAQIADLGALVAFGAETGGGAVQAEQSIVDLFRAATTSAIEVSDVSGDLQSTLNDKVADQQQEITDLEGHVTRIVLASWIVTFVAIAGGAILVTTDIVRRVEGLIDSGRRFLAGEPLRSEQRSGDELDELVGKLLYIGDLLEQRREEAVAATRTRDALLARTSHELRTPLNAIIGHGQIIEADQDLVPAQRTAVHHIVRGGDHLLALIDDLLDISRIESGSLSVISESVPLGQIADEAVAMVRRRATDRSIDIETDISSNLVVVADRRRLRQILLNLLTNAVKYNEPSGHIAVTARGRDGTARLSVADTGPGISPEDQARLFRPFERLHAAETNVEGSGIGLALTKHLADAMDGTISVESTVGQGTTFHVDLPTPTASGPADGLPPTGPPEGTPALRPIDPPAIHHPETVRPDPERTARHTDLEAAGATQTGVPHQDGPGGVRRPGHRSFHRRWADTPVRRKILAVMAVALLVSLPAVSLAAVLELRLASVLSTSRSTEEQLDDLASLQDLSVDATNAMASYSVSLFSGENGEEHLTDFRRVADAAPDLAARIHESVPTLLRGQMDEVQTELDAQMEAFATLVETGELSPTEEDDPTADTFTVGVAAGVEVSDHIGAVESRLKERLATQRHDVSSLETLVTRAVIASWAISFLAILGGTALVTGDVVRRVERLAENARRFLDGEPLLPFQQSNDEIGQLIEDSAVIGGLLEQRRSEAEAATRRRDDFLSRISHELRTPLTAIVGFAEILEDEEDLSATSHDAAHNIAICSERLLATTNDILDLSKLETDHLPLDVEPVDVHQVAENAAAQMQPDAAARGVTITATVTSGLLVHADRQRLEQILVNLLAHAVERSSQSGRVDLTATDRGERATVSITDSGPPIPPDDQTRLFRPFERLGAEGGPEDSGIAFALTRGLTEAMGGTVTVDSAVGEATTFHVDLPAVMVAP